MVNHKDERVIYIKDMLFAVLYRWRTILLFALILALTMGGYRVFSLRNMDASDAASLKKAQDNYELKKQALTQEITSLENRIESIRSHIAMSPFMALNPRSVYVSELHIYLETQNTTVMPGDSSSDPADALLSVYHTLLMKNETLDSIATAMDMEGMSLEAIIDVTCNETANLLTVVVRQAEQEKAEAIMELMQQEIDNAQVQISDVMGDHKLSVLDSSTSLRDDTELAQLQSKKSEELSKLNDSLDARIADRSSLVKPVERPITTRQILVSVAQYSLLAGLLGFLGIVVLILIAHLSRNKVYSRRTLEDQTGLAILGCLPGGKKRRGIDRWLRKLEGRCVSPAKQQSALIAARIQLLCGSDCALLLSGAGNADDRLPLLTALEEQGCKVVGNGDILQDVEAVQALSSCSNVILVEQCGKSLYTSVAEAAEHAKAVGKPVLGCVLIDG